MSKWFYANLIVLFIAIGKLIMSNVPLSSRVPVIFGFLGLLFILFNWTRHAVFSTIRNIPERKTKIKFANLSKKVLPFHRWTGTTALILILIHVTLVFQKYGGFSMQNIKMVSGLVAGVLLLSMVTSGWIRLFNPTVTMRKIHLYIGLTMFFLVTIHLLL